MELQASNAFLRSELEEVKEDLEKARDARSEAIRQCSEAEDRGRVVDRLLSQAQAAAAERVDFVVVRDLVKKVFDSEIAECFNEAINVRELDLAVMVAKHVHAAVWREARELREAERAVTPADPEPVEPPKYRVILTRVSEQHVIQAIKAVREVSNLGLKEAKDIVDAVKAGAEQPIPASFNNYTRTAEEAHRCAQLLKNAAATIRVDHITAGEGVAS